MKRKLIIALALLIPLAVWASGMMGVGVMMQPMGSGGGPPPVETYRITTESNNVITTESGDALRTETP